MLYKTSLEFANGDLKGSRPSTFAGNSALLPSDVKDFARSETFGGKDFLSLDVM